MKTVSPRKKKILLAAAIGVATVNFLNCEVGTSGNLVAPPTCEERGDCDAGVDAGADGGVADSGADGGS